MVYLQIKSAMEDPLKKLYEKTPSRIIHQYSAETLQKYNERVNDLLKKTPYKLDDFFKEAIEKVKKEIQARL